MIGFQMRPVRACAWKSSLVRTAFFHDDERESIRSELPSGTSMYFPSGVYVAHGGGIFVVIGAAAAAAAPEAVLLADPCCICCICWFCNGISCNVVLVSLYASKTSTEGISVVHRISLPSGENTIPSIAAGVSCGTIHVANGPLSCCLMSNSRTRPLPLLPLLPTANTMPVGSIANVGRVISTPPAIAVCWLLSCSFPWHIGLLSLKSHRRTLPSTLPEMNPSSRGCISMHVTPSVCPRYTRSMRLS